MKKILTSMATVMLLLAGPTVHASIYGTLSNFDTYNETEIDSYGAEIELEGVHVEDLYRTFPSHYDNEVRTYYQEGAQSGTRITYSGYNFTTSGYLPANTIGQSTNGHACVGTEGCEHFGFSLTGVQPTATRFYWLDQNGQRIGTMPESIATPTWNYVANPGGVPRLGAIVEAPEPAEVIPQRPDSIWMKVFKTEIDRPVDLMELMSDNRIIPDNIGEQETEWELLEGGLGKQNEAEDDIGEGNFAVIRRYEYFEYTGPYDEEHEPISIFLDEDLPEPPVGELGQFISANMVAANLAAPEEADFNQDGNVDGRDFLAWQRGFGQGHKLEDGDANWDDSVDDNDLAIWKNKYEGDDNPGLVSVPEPATWLIVALSVLGALCFRGQRNSYNEASA
ncbi:hypothetical protein [Bythopirellula polymerisocia]|uniref:PEP-CTERM protein-sorting domain-containing protein n=1 Tax=Bythopirellula polymerisocia TaxID=2528003 RepID=A0A5C6CMJ8_9BACT|nr:hypothetical protein [Bythopirellula polymerisocia]TWU24694.1 hypothetical protein Pla144_35800 [Bythopirellula polymerisocia]